MIPKYREHDLPSFDQFYKKPNYEAIPKGTDVYFFGMPGAGKTSLLMGLTGADGKGYSINYRTNGGPYAQALKQYVEAGVMPGVCPSNFVDIVSATIEEKRKGRNGKEACWNHDINFIKTNGSEFAQKIANNEGVEIEDMGDGTTALLRNHNRKVFFIIIDPTAETIKFDRFKEMRDDNGNVMDFKPVTEYISKSACISKFVFWFDMHENKDLMKRVDAIHFIVTKADMFGQTDTERKERARDLLLQKYEDPIHNLIAFCRRSGRINYVTDYLPMVYPFSLGRFSDDRTFEYDNRSSLAIIDALRHMTAAKKEGDFWDDLRDCLLKPL